MHAHAQDLAGGGVLALCLASRCSWLVGRRLDPALGESAGRTGPTWRTSWADQPCALMWSMTEVKASGGEKSTYSQSSSATGARPGGQAIEDGEGAGDAAHSAEEPGGEVVARRTSGSRADW